jgi:hypothetical protein
MANNDFFTVVNFIKDRLLANTNVNTVVFATLQQKDFQEKNIYPIVHINPISAPITSSAVNYFTFEIGCFDQRDMSNDIATDKWDGQDDLQDNLNITYVILNDLINYLRNQNNDSLIELESTTDLTPLLLNDLNVLDGWIVNITLTIPNNTFCETI